MNNNLYESLNNDKDESSGDDGSSGLRRKEKNSLRIRLNRVFSSGRSVSPMSPGPCSSRASSRGSSPGHGRTSTSPSTKFRYSWHTSGFSNKTDDRSPQRSPRSTTPTKWFTTRNGNFGSNGSSPATPKNHHSPTVWYDGVRMKYSPQQQQKERKSESESMTATPSRDLENRTRNSTTVDGSREDRPTATSAISRFAICRRGNSTGMFAWMRVFRLATMLNQVGC